MSTSTRVSHLDERTGEKVIERLTEDLIRMRRALCMKRVYVDVVSEQEIGETMTLEFIEPPRTDVVVVRGYMSVGVFFDPRGFEMRGISVDKYGSISVVLDNARAQINTVDLLAHLLYSGGYEHIRRGEYRGSEELANILLDLGEMAHGVDSTTVPASSLREDDHYTDIATYIRWSVADWTTLKYVGLRLSWAPAVPVITVAGDDALSGGSRHIVVRFDDTSKKTVFRLSKSKALDLPPVRRLLESLGEIEERVGRYSEAYARAYVGVRAYTSYFGES